MTNLTGRELDAAIAERIMDMVPCDKWGRHNLGSAGGPVLLKACSHKEGECYSTLEMPCIMGSLGGPPKYSSSLDACREALKVLPSKIKSVHEFTRLLKIELIGEKDWHLCSDFAVLTAEPEKICRAMLAVLNNGKEK